MANSVYNYITRSYNLEYNNLNILECGASDLAIDTKPFRLTNNCYYIEADPNSVEYFKINAPNVTLNNVFNYALHNFNGETTFTLTSHGGNSSYNHSEEHKNELINHYNSSFTDIKVKTITFKKFIEHKIKTNIDILVLDVEGCETIILETFKELNNNQLPKIICIECGYEWEQKKKLLLELGYTLDFYGFNNCYASFGDIHKNTDNIQENNLNNKSFIWYGNTLYINDLL